MNPVFSALLVAGLKAAPTVTSAAVSPFDTAALNKIVGFEGEKVGAVFKFTAGREDLHLTEMGAVINARMGLNSWAAFAASHADAQIAGDIAMRESEVNSMWKVLRAHDLNIVAIHHYMLSTQPAVIFLHYWGSGPALKLAVGFRAALVSWVSNSALSGQAADSETCASYWLHPWYAYATFLKPGKILFSLRGTSFFCSQRFLQPISSRFSNKPAGSPAAFCCFF